MGRIRTSSIFFAAFVLHGVVFGTFCVDGDIGSEVKSLLGDKYKEIDPRSS